MEIAPDRVYMNIDYHNSGLDTIPAQATVKLATPMLQGTRPDHYDLAVARFSVPNKYFYDTGINENVSAVIIKTTKFAIVGEWDANVQFTFLLDVLVDMPNAAHFNPPLASYNPEPIIYEPNFYRRHQLLGQDPITEYDVQIWYRLKTGTLEQLPLRAGEQFSVKFVMLKRGLLL